MMFKVLQYAAAAAVGAAVLALPASAAGRAEYSTQEAASHEGEQAAVCGLVSGVHSSQKAWFINLDGKYPNQLYTLVIWKSDWPAGSAPDLASYNGSRLHLIHTAAAFRQQNPRKNPCCSKFRQENQPVC